MRKNRISLPLCLLGIALASPALAGPPDEKLRVAAEAAKPALIDTLRDMVMIESGSSDVEGLAKMADFTEARLKALGARTERRKVTRGAGANRSAKAVVVESFGLAGYGYHARDEYIDAGSIVPRLYLMTRMLTELGKQK